MAQKSRSILSDIRKKCAYVADHADYVSINTARIADYVRELPLDKIVDELGTDIHFIGGFQQHSRAWFPGVAFFAVFRDNTFRMVWAIVKFIDMRSAFSEQFIDPFMYLLKRCLSNDPPCHCRLICYDN